MGWLWSKEREDTEDRVIISSAKASLGALTNQKGAHEENARSTHHHIKDVFLWVLYVWLMIVDSTVMFTSSDPFKLQRRRPCR